MSSPLDKEQLSQQLAVLFEHSSKRTPDHVVEQPHEEQEQRKKPASPFGNNPPEMAVFPSNSYRKAVMLYWSLLAQYDLSQWPGFVAHIEHVPEELTDAKSVVSYFERHIHNGDGVVRHPFLIGYWPDGVPLYLCPTDGETSGNDDPVQEAHNKIDDIRHLFAGRDVVFFSTDAVQDIRTSDQKLGKPLNRAEYKVAAAAGEVEIFKAEYLQRFYVSPDGDPLHDRHITGLVVARGDVQYEEEIVLSVEVQEWLLQFVEVHLGMGGGGIFQQFIWLLEQQEREIWLKLQNDDLAEYLRGIDSQLWSFTVIFHIMGVPAWKILAAFEKISQELPDEEFA